MRDKFSLPKRLYSGGDKKMISMRLSEDLWGELEKLAVEYGWTTTDLVTTALDEFVQWALKKPKQRK